VVRIHFSVLTCDATYAVCGLFNSVVIVWVYTVSNGALIGEQ
jgi:hypothetical protein